MGIEVVRLPSRPADWDARVRDLPGKTLFHESVWLDHVETISAPSRLQYYELRDGAEAIGVFVGVRQRRVMISLLGSPLPGTGTNFMGPLILDRARLSEAMLAVIAQCRRERIMHLELANPLLEEVDTAALGLDAHPSVTHIVPLPDTEVVAWQGIKSSCRNRVRKAEKAGLVCEITADASIVDHFHKQYREVYAKQGLALPIGRKEIQSLYDHLLPVARVLPIWVKLNDEVLAAGLFPFDENAIYFWGAASWLKYQHLCPNELLHWTVMKLAISRGIPIYNMCGGTSQFKDKFGGSDVPYVRYSLSFARWLATARIVYERLRRAKVRTLGMFQKRPERVKGDERDG